jgi:hypothetical protein
MSKKLLFKITSLIILAIALSACSQFKFWQGEHSGYGEYGEYGQEGGQHPGAQKPKHYLKADRPPPDVARMREKCVNVGGRQVCGYDCKVVGGQAKCASNPKERCVVSPSGGIICGYNCKATHSGAKCGKYLYDNCVTNGLGEIKCGNNCREREDGELICGK